MVAMVVGTAAAVGHVGLAGRAMADCDVGINASANSFTLLFVLPVLVLVDATVFGVVFVFGHRAAARLVRPARRRGRAGVGGLAFLAAALALALMAWAVVALALSGGYVVAFCPNNGPAWWPSWLPV